jgi:hypothetical protein
MRYNARVRIGIASLLFLLLLPPLEAQPLAPLHVHGTRIVNDLDTPVPLRGVNLGGWLVEEMWMMPFVTRPPAGSDAAEIRDHVTLWSTIESRLGKDAAQRMRESLRENWITESDFDRIRDDHLNCVRLPFLCDSLDPPDDLFAWLDRAVDWAGKRGIYVILDMHGAPGRQSKDHHTGQAGVNRFFYDEEDIRRGEQIWTKIAARYRDRPEVAGYDLLNEPMGAPNQATLYLVQDRLYRAIRSVDEKHVIFIEDGYKGAEDMPVPSVCGWRNVALSVHTYKFDAAGPADQIEHLGKAVESLVSAQETHAVPFYIGEFNTPHADAQTLAKFIQTFDEHGWPWSMWCYKVAGGRGFGRGEHSTWGWVCPGRFDRLDPFRDSEDQWNQKVKQFRTENMVVQDDVAAALRGK